MINKIVIVGATSLIAERCARLWLEESPRKLVLLGRDKKRTERVADDLRVRSPKSDIDVKVIDFSDSSCIHEWVKAVCEDEVPDIVLIAHGALPDQQECQKDLALNEAVLRLNGISPVLFAEAFSGYFEKANKGKLAIIGSVAGDRGRKSNYIYGSAKGLLTRYAQGLQHRFASTNVKVILVKPGPTDTPMTANLKEKGAKLADVDSVAIEIVESIRKNKPTAYVPGKWKAIMMIVRHLPKMIFDKIDI